MAVTAGTLIPDSAASGAAVGTGGVDSGITHNTMTADTARCVYVRDGQNAAGKPMWKSTQVQLSGNKLSTSIRYKESPNCPAERVQRRADAPPVVS